MPHVLLARCNICKACSVSFIKHSATNESNKQSLHPMCDFLQTKHCDCCNTDVTQGMATGLSRRQKAISGGGVRAMWGALEGEGGGGGGEGS